MKEPPSTGQPDPRVRRVVLTDFHVMDTADRPERYLDVDGLVRQAPDVRICCAARVGTDEELERRLGRWTRSMATRALLGHGLGPWVVLRHYLAVRRADVVVCHAPHHFWWVVLLHRLRLLPRGKNRAVRGIFFRTTGFQRKRRLFREAPAGFQAAFATRQQVDLLAGEGVPATRLRFIPWRIDTAWFRPRAVLSLEEKAPAPYVLCPGSAKRDEALVASLVGRLGGGVRVIRMGRMPVLETLYQAALQRPGDFELHVNATHREYLGLLQNAALVILPIVPCDEPAGLTAALEALACGVPLLANESAGIGPLLREAGVADTALLNAPDPAAWERAIRSALASRRSDPEASRLRWERARAAVLAAHAIGPEDDAVRWLLGAA